MSQALSPIRAALDAMDGPVRLLEPDMDVAIVGLSTPPGQAPVVCYDRDKVIQVLMQRDGMDAEGARIFLEENIEEAYLGDGMPLFLESTASLLRHSLPCACC